MPEMVLKSMKIDKKARGEQSMKSPDVDMPMYPYGLQVNLDNEALEALGLKRLPTVGKSMMLVARCDVTSVSEHEHKEGGESKTNRGVSLQITDLAIGADEGSNKPKAQDVLYKKG